MNKRATLIGGILTIMVSLLSIALHYEPITEIRSSDLVELNDRKVVYEIDWRSPLAANPQFAPKEIDQAGNDSSAEEGIQYGRLIGIVPDRPSLAIVIPPNSNNVLRIGPGEGWLDGWLLNKVTTDHVIWQNSKTNEEYKQYLFARGKGTIPTPE